MNNNDETIKYAKEVNEHIRAALDNWADIVLDMDARKMSFYMDYFPADIMNATFIFNHVVTNVGIKKGIINGNTAAEYGRRLRQLILEATGIDTTTGAPIDNEHNLNMN